MLCSNCGHEIEEGQKYCHNCGKTVDPNEEWKKESGNVGLLFAIGAIPFALLFMNQTLGLENYFKFSGAVVFLILYGVAALGLCLFALIKASLLINKVRVYYNKTLATIIIASLVALFLLIVFIMIEMKLDGSYGVDDIKLLL